MWQWSAHAVPALAVAFFAWGAAWFLWTSGRPVERERRLAALLAVAGAALFADPGLLLLADTASAAHAAAFVSTMFLVVLPFLHLRLIATFPGAATLPLRVPVLAFVALVATLLGLMLGALQPEWAVARVHRAAALGGWYAMPALVGKLAIAAWLVTLAYGALVTGLAMTKAPTSEQAALRSWTMAYVALAITAALHVFARLWSAEADVEAGVAVVAGANAFLAAIPLALFTGSALQAVARQRPEGGTRGARRFVSGTTVVALFTFPIVLSGELLERVAPVSSAVAGIAVAVVLAMALRPIQRLADRVARRIVHDTEAVAPGAAELYRSAIQGAFGDGEINAKEHRTLQRLADQLGLPNEEARRIEAETLAALRQ